MRQRDNKARAGRRQTVALYLLIVLLPHSVAAQAPTIDLFPVKVIENVRETGRVAGEMESALQDSLADLQRGRRLYQESGCAGAAGDPVCDQIDTLMGDTYLNMLLLMDASLPRMRSSVQATVNSLEKQLRTEFGLRMSASDLQQLLAGQPADGRRLDPNGNSQPVTRLSERFRQYYQLVSQTRTTRQASMPLVAAEIYLDGKAVLELIAATENEIARSRVLLEMRHGVGGVTPEMNDVLAGVTSILFGADARVRSQAAKPRPDGFAE